MSANQLHEEDTKEKIRAILIKASATSNCLFTLKSHCPDLSDDILYGVLWSLDDYLDELKLLYEDIEETETEKNTYLSKITDISTYIQSSIKDKA